MAECISCGEPGWVFTDNVRALLLRYFGEIALAVLEAKAKAHCLDCTLCWCSLQSRGRYKHNVQATVRRRRQYLLSSEAIDRDAPSPREVQRRTRLRGEWFAAKRVHKELKQENRRICPEEVDFGGRCVKKLGHRGKHYNGLLNWRD